MTFVGSKRGEGLNRYSHFAPRMGWMRQFFELKNKFFDKNNLGSVMLRFFKRFLLDAELLDQRGLFSMTAERLAQLGISNKKSWGIIAVNLSIGSPLVRWYLRRVNFNEIYSRSCLAEMMKNQGVKGASDAIVALGQLCSLPLEEIGFGKSEYKRDKNNRNTLLSITRSKWEDPSQVIILYSLYKFAEISGWNYGFRFEKLYDFSEEVISPVRIFGIRERNMINILNGLSVSYPKFISVSFTLDLQSIKLNPLKSSIDVLKMITP